MDRDREGEAYRRILAAL